MLKKLVVLILLGACFLSSTALCEGKLKVTEKNLFLFSNDDTGYFFAKIENVGDAAAGVGSGDLVLFSEDDEILLSNSYITTLPSSVVIDPGEYLYVKEFLWDSALQNNTVSDYKFSMPLDRRTTTVSTVPCESSYDDEYIYVTFTNTTNEPLLDLYVVGALYDSNGNLIYADSNSIFKVSIYPGSTITARIYIDDDLRNYYAMNGISPSSVVGTVYSKSK